MSMEHWVTVKATKKGNKVEFDADCEELWDGKKFVFDKDKLNMNKSDNHLLKFALDDRTGLGLRFPANPADAMWVKEIPNANTYDCPDENDHDYAVIKPLNVIDGGTRLIARNTNPDRRKWSFSLNFVKEGKLDSDIASYVCWDPIGDNNDGGRTSSSSNLVSYAAVGATTGILSALVTAFAFTNFYVACPSVAAL